MDLESFVTGGSGCRMVTSSSGAVVENFYAFTVNEDAVVSAILDKNGNDAMDTYKLSGVTLKSGQLLYANTNQYFTSITLSSGSVIMHKAL